MVKITDDIRDELRASIRVFGLTFVVFTIVTSFVMGPSGIWAALTVAIVVTLFCLFPILLELLLTSPVKALHFLGRILVVLTFAAIGVAAGTFFITRFEGVDPAGAASFVPALAAVLLGYAGWRMRVLGLEY
ncbi:MAG: hypothetical protein JJU21_06885 [Salinarimonas sp.]|nr:hypothetical protein [Salinarimonas sp.]